VRLFVTPIFPDLEFDATSFLGHGAELHRTSVEEHVGLSAFVWTNEAKATIREKGLNLACLHSISFSENYVHVQSAAECAGGVKRQFFGTGSQD